MPLSQYTFVCSHSAQDGSLWGPIARLRVCSCLTVIKHMDSVPWRAPFCSLWHLGSAFQLSVGGVEQALGWAPRSVPWFFARKLGWSDTWWIGGGC